MIADIATAFEAAGGVISSFVDAIVKLTSSGVRAHDFLKTRREKARFKELIKRLMLLEWQQRTLPWVIESYCIKPDAREWKLIVDGVAELSVMVSELIELLAKDTSDFIARAPKEYRELLLSLKARQEAYRLLSDQRPPRSRRDIQSLRRIAESYLSLCSRLRSSEEALARYLTDEDERKLLTADEKVIGLTFEEIKEKGRRKI